MASELNQKCSKKKGAKSNLCAKFPRVYEIGDHLLEPLYMNIVIYQSIDFCQDILLTSSFFGVSEVFH